jgi:aromatic ring-opening dioxygenase catalytic subunit (LigB family)
MTAEDIANAIRTLALDRALLDEFKSHPTGVGARLGLDETVSRIIASGDRGALRGYGIDSGTTILVGRWFGDSAEDTHYDTAFTVPTTGTVADADVPRSLVFAGGCSHVPDFLARPEIDPPGQIDRLKAGYRSLADLLAEQNPDVLIVTADNHFQKFNTSGYVIGTGPHHSGSMAFFNRPDLDLKIAGHPDLSAAMIETARGSGIEVEECHAIELDHGLIVPLRQVLPSPDLPIVPLLTQPAKGYSPFSARALGVALRDAIDASGLRVGILATGGLSHWLDPGKFGFVDEEFDMYLLQMMQAGRGPEIGDLEPYPLLDHGQYEFLNWLIMLGVVGPGVPADVLAYEPMTASGGGWTVVHMPLPALVHHVQ